MLTNYLDKMNKFLKKIETAETDSKEIGNVNKQELQHWISISK